LDGWARWDMPSNDYYDTEEFPEGYTGYDGSEVWDFVHNKICFEGYDYDDDHWKADFNRAVSGVHSVVSAQVTRGIQDKIDAGEEFTAKEVWRDPRAEFERRLGRNGETPMAMENLYFAYMLFLSAAAKAGDRLLADCQSGRQMIDGESASVLGGLLSLPLLSDPAVMVAPRKLHDHAIRSPNDLWELRLRTRNLLRLMNCVQCNKCRLHGKIAMMGMSTALQIHLGRSGEGGDPNRIHRVELAALISTIYKMSRAVDFCKRMR
jgi:ERO1-like protein alpha